MATKVTPGKPIAKARSRVPAAVVKQVVAAPKPANDKGLLTLARDLRSWTGFVLGLANTAADMSFRVASSRLTKPSHKAAVDKAGSLFRSLREGAGLTLQDIGQAIDLKDLSLLEAVEVGKVGLPFEIILRLAGVLGRNDPIPIAMRLTRAYNPKLWATLESLGIGRQADLADLDRFEQRHIFQVDRLPEVLEGQARALAQAAEKAAGLVDRRLVRRLGQARTRDPKRHVGRRVRQAEHEAGPGAQVACQRQQALVVGRPGSGHDPLRHHGWPARTGLGNGLAGSDFGGHSILHRD